MLGKIDPIPFAVQGRATPEVSVFGARRLPIPVKFPQSCPTLCDPVGYMVAHQALLSMGFSRQEPNPGAVAGEGAPRAGCGSAGGRVTGQWPSFPAHAPHPRRPAGCTEGAGPALEAEGSDLGILVPRKGLVLILTSVLEELRPFHTNQWWTF